MEYKKLQKNYPFTTEALQVPLYIARYYQGHGQAAEGNRVLADALIGYQELFRQKGAKRLAPAIQDSIAGVYGMTGKWENALKALETLRTKYPDDPRSALALVRMGVIYEQGLRNPDMARRAFIQFLQEYPNHNMTPIVQRMVEKLK